MLVTSDRCSVCNSPGSLVGHYDTLVRLVFSVMSRSVALVVTPSGSDYDTLEQAIFAARNSSSGAVVSRLLSSNAFPIRRSTGLDALAVHPKRVARVRRAIDADEQARAQLRSLFAAAADTALQYECGTDTKRRQCRWDGPMKVRAFGLGISIRRALLTRFSETHSVVCISVVLSVILWLCSVVAVVQEL